MPKLAGGTYARVDIDHRSSEKKLAQWVGEAPRACRVAVTATVHHRWERQCERTPLIYQRRNDSPRVRRALRRCGGQLAERAVTSGVGAVKSLATKDTK